MVAFNFPDTPTVGDIFTNGIQSWQWDGISWNIVPTLIAGPPGTPGAGFDVLSVLTTDGDILTRNASTLAPITRAALAADPAFAALGGGGASIFVGPDAPPAPTDGKLWFDNDDTSVLQSNVDPVTLAADAAFTSKYAMMYLGTGAPAAVDGKLWLDTDDTAISPSTVDPNVLAVDAAFSSRYAASTLGRVGSCTNGTDQTGIAGEIGLTGYSITFTAVAGRRYVLHYCFAASQQTSAGLQQFRYYKNGVNQGIIDAANVQPSIVRMIAGFWEIGTLTAGSTTVSLTGQTSAGTMFIANTSNLMGRMIIYDVGV